jgi:pseudaminic acid cytidylyltransferase
MNIAVIPARGGSKRIPRKNVKKFHGLPVISYAIKAAKKSQIFDEVIVSTDDEEIADIASSFGATIPWMRPMDLSDDYSTTISVMRDAVKRLEVSFVDLENVCCIYPATPFLSPKDLLHSFNVLESGNWSYVFSGVRARISPLRYLSLGMSGEVVNHMPELGILRTQDLKDFYMDAGQFYWGKKSSWSSGLPIFADHSTIIELPHERGIDIDTMEDWNYAEYLFKASIIE